MAAVVVANAGQMLRRAKCSAYGRRRLPGEGWPLRDLAFATYTDFANRYPQARVSAVRALAQLALRTQATQTAKLALGASRV